MSGSGDSCQTRLNWFRMAHGLALDDMSSELKFFLSCHEMMVCVWESAVYADGLGFIG